jgi:hypothetical protein
MAEPKPKPRPQCKFCGAAFSGVSAKNRHEKETCPVGVSDEARAAARLQKREAAALLREAKALDAEMAQVRQGLIELLGNPKLWDDEE